MAQRFGEIVIDIAKLHDYCLSETHPRGRHKARVFRSSLGLTTADAEFLRSVLADAARNRQQDLRLVGSDEFGQRFILDFPVTVRERTARLRSAWIVPAGGDMLRFVTCYVL